jgi:cation-transporting ATPase E
VQQSNAIESLSNTDVLCLDKTGTLTANKLRVSGIHPLDAGNASGGEGISRDAPTVTTLTRDAFADVLGDVVASISSGTKTSEAIAEALPGQQRRRVAEVAFSSARKWCAVALDDDARRGTYVMGAPELLRPYLGPASDPDSDAWHAIQSTVSELAAQGLRVLLLAHFPDPAALREDDIDPRLPEGMTPLGLVSLSDELRPEAREALLAFQQAGVHPKIISGDNPETVTALARQAGLGPDLQMVSGSELEGLDDAELQRVAVATIVFGRITPQMKERIVQALRDAGHYVAMIGDGVNDVLSLKRAHLGIAMHSGSQATRGVADIVLLNDSFAVMVPAVAEGQRIINGMQDILKLFVTRISTVGLLILSSMVVGIFPLALRQGSVVTLLTVAVPTIFLAVWARPGETPKGTFAQRLAHFVLPPALMTTAIGLILLYGTLVALISHDHGFNVDISGNAFTAMRNANLPLARTTLTCFLTLCGLLLVVFVEPPRPWWTGGDVLSADHRPTYLAIALTAVFIVIMLVPGFRHLFDLSPLGLAEWSYLIVALVIWLVCVRLMWRRNVLGGFLGLPNL